jgi:hypothetical protein
MATRWISATPGPLKLSPSSAASARCPRSRIVEFDSLRRLPVAMHHKQSGGERTRAARARGSTEAH